MKDKAQRKRELTLHEIDIVKLICEEYTAAEIAAQLAISPHTVEAHRYNIMRKTGVKASIGIFKYTIIRGIVSLQHQTIASTKESS